MAGELRKEVCIRITERMKALPSTFSEHTIFRVPRCLYQANPKGYEPRIISIGPYHHGKPHLEMMEVHKVRYLSMLLARINEDNLEMLVASVQLQGTVQKARNCYAQLSSIEKMCDKKFLEIMVIDGCFIIELIHQLHERNKDEYVFKYWIIIKEIMRDLILFENQLPFFLLLELIGMTSGKHRDLNWHISCLLKIYNGKIPGVRVEHALTENANHLLDVVTKNWLPSEEVIDAYSKAPKDSTWLFIRSATELREAGIQFKKGQGNSLFDIKFENGVLEIPTITVSDNTETFYRNIILCEQYGNLKQKYFTDFHAVIDCLINTGKDVEILCRRGIIENLLGDDDAAAAMINSLGDHVSLSKEDFFYAQLFNDVNKHFNKLWNRWKASLKRNYFNTPWALISFLAAVFLLVLTGLQTFFSIFPQ